jgi:hypothetical protein
MYLRKLVFGLFWFLNGRHVNANPVPSNETLLDSLVLVSAYIFPNQSALEGAVKDSSWQRYDNVDASSYWSTGKQDIQTADVSVTTYAYTADNLARRDGDGKKKHHYLGALAIFPIDGIGYGGWKIHDKYFKTKPGVQPTGVNVAGLSVPTLPNTPGIGPPNTIPPEILKPGTLENIITSHDTGQTANKQPPPDGKPATPPDRQLKDFEKPDYKPKQPEIPKDRWDPRKKPPPGNNPPGERPPPTNQPPSEDKTNPFKKPEPKSQWSDIFWDKEAPPKHNPSIDVGPKGEQPTYEQPKGTHDTAHPKSPEGIDASKPGSNTGSGSSTGAKTHPVDPHSKPIHLDANGKPVHYDVKIGDTLRSIDPVTGFDKATG